MNADSRSALASTEVQAFGEAIRPLPLPLISIRTYTDEDSGQTLYVPERTKQTRTRAVKSVSSVVQGGTVRAPRRQKSCG